MFFLSLKKNPVTLSIFIFVFFLLLCTINNCRSSNNKPVRQFHAFGQPSGSARVWQISRLGVIAPLADNLTLLSLRRHQLLQHNATLGKGGGLALVVNDDGWQCEPCIALHAGPNHLVKLQRRDYHTRLRVLQLPPYLHRRISRIYQRHLIYLRIIQSTECFARNKIFGADVNCWFIRFDWKMKNYKFQKKKIILKL